MTKKRSLNDYFSTLATRKAATRSSPTTTIKQVRTTTNAQAETLAARLQTRPIYLTPNGESWYLLIRQWKLPTSSDEFETEWNSHPQTRHKLKVYGRKVTENRWSQSWGVSYAYSGATNVARPIHESVVLPKLMANVNELMTDLSSSEEEPYNGCLQNWYQPDDTIGLHSDDERSQRHDCPIFSLSWGGVRRFLLRERKDRNVKTELFLRDGDLLVMGGTCQQTHYHEVPKLRKTMDPPTSNRINWTIRAFETTSAEAKKKKAKNGSSEGTN